MTKSSRIRRRKTARKPTRKTTRKAAGKASGKGQKKATKASRKAAEPKVVAKAGAGGVPLPATEIRKAAEDMRDLLLKLDKWITAYTNTLSVEPLLVGGRTPEKDYYIVEFRQGGSTTGLIIVNALTGKVGQAAGIRTPTEKLFRFYRPDEVPDLVDGRAELFNDSRRVTISGANVNVQTKLFWIPCDQSPTQFLPIYVVDHVKEHVRDVLWVRVDGEIYTRITQGGKGL